MHNALSLQGMFDNTTQLPSGLIVPTHSAEALIKSEAAKQVKADNKASFFSKFALGANSSQGAREKPGGTPQFALLYEAAEKSTIDRILIRARTDQTKRIWQKANDGKSKEVGYRVVHERQDDPDYKVTAGDKERCREMEKLIGDPTPTEHMWLYPHQVRPHTRLKDLVGVLTQAELIIDRKVILRYKRADGQGYSAFHWLPGETIKNVDESIRAWAQKNETGGKINKYTIDRMSYLTGFDLARASYVQMIDGMITGAFTDDEISVHISNPSDRLNRYGYGTSRLEESLDFTTNLLMAFNYNKEALRPNYPEQVLAVSGDYDKEGLAAFKQQILGEAGGVGNNWRLPVIPAGDIDNFKIESIKLRETPKDMLFDKMIELLLALKCSAFGAHPSTLNLSTYAGTSGQNGLGGHNPADEIEFSKERGLIPALQDMTEWLTDAVIRPRYDDLKIIIVGMNPDDEQAAVGIRTSRVSKWITRNECRMEEGLLPLGDLKDTENPWNYPADVPIPNYLNTFSQAEQQQAQNDQDQSDGQDDSQDQDQPDDDSDQYYKSLRKSKPETKYLNIRID